MTSQHSPDDSEPNDDRASSDDFAVTGLPTACRQPVSSERSSTATRRRVLAVVGGVAATLAGCSAADSTDTRTATATDATATETATPTATETATGTPASPADVARTLLARLDGGEYEAAAGMLGDDAAEQLSARNLQWYWRGLVAQHGAYESATVEGASGGSERATVRMTLTCAQDDAPVSVTVDGEGRVVGLVWTAEYAPPAYADESAFTEREFEVPGEDPLPGTLSLPTGEGPHPAVVLVHGTGAHDRDETIGPNRPFRDLAWGLASRGIAVARYDKRTEEYDVAPGDRTLDAVTVDDAVAAAESVQDVTEVDADSVLVVGHSQGAAAAPRIAEKHGDLAGVAMLAGNSQPITDVLLAQNKRLLKHRDGSLSDADRSRLDRLEAAIRRIERREYPPGQRIGNLSAALLYSFLDYDQVATAQSLSAPVFVGHGGRDWQVGRTNYERWVDALPPERTRGEWYESLNHVFQRGTSPSTRTEYLFFDNVAEQVVTDLAEWVTEQSAGGS